MELWWPISGEGKARDIILQYWNTILLLHVLACDLKWQSPVGLGPLLQLIFILNIAQGILVNASIPMHRGGFKYKLGRILLWMFSSHAQHNPFLLSFQKQGPSCCVPLRYMFVFHQRSESFRLVYSPHTKGRFILQEDSSLHKDIPSDSQLPKKSQS